MMINSTVDEDYQKVCTLQKCVLKTKEIVMTLERNNLKKQFLNSHRKQFQKTCHFFTTRKRKWPLLQSTIHKKNANQTEFQLTNFEHFSTSSAGNTKLLFCEYQQKKKPFAHASNVRFIHVRSSLHRNGSLKYTVRKKCVVTSLFMEVRRRAFHRSRTHTQ